MKYELKTRWTGKNIAFTSEVDGFTVNMDSPQDTNADGPSPKRLMLLSVLGCTGMDVISLLEKMRVPVDEFTIEGIAPITEEHPKVFESVHLIYKVKGSGIKRDKVEKAIDLSQTRYCGVSIMLKKHCPVTWELEIEEV